MKAHISDHITYKKTFQLTIFPIVMMVFLSLYSVIDGIFIANFSSNSAFAAVNLVFPFIMIIGSIGFMMGTGGTAFVSKLLGEKKSEEANSAFSLIIYFTIGLGVVIALASFFCIKPIVYALKNISPSSSDEMIEYAITYGSFLMLSQPLFILQNVFQSFFMVAEKPKLGFLFTVAGGVSNIILDALFIGLFRWGIVGAALATISGYLIAGLGPLIYFIFNKNGLIHLGKCKFSLRVIARTMYNGMSEFISNISMNLTAVIYNIKLLEAYGENGVSAYGIIMYVSFIFIAIFIGYAIGMAPVVGYNYGAKNQDELKNVLKKSMFIILITSLFMSAFSFFSARPFSKIFAAGNEELLLLSIKAMRIYSLAYLFFGFTLFISSFFTALNNGTISAIIAIARTLVFQIGFVFLFYYLFKGEGIWWSLVVSEALSIIVGFSFIFANKKKYGY